MAKTRRNISDVIVMAAIVVIIASAFGIGMYGSPTGLFLKKLSRGLPVAQPASRAGVCYDSDGKTLDQYSQNHVLLNGVRYYDRCKTDGSGIMQEAVCSGSGVVYSDYACGSKGLICYNGACATPPACTLELDCGMDIAKGQYCNRNKIIQDVKVYGCDKAGLPGASCKEKTSSYNIYTCPSGTVCQRTSSDNAGCYKLCNQDQECDPPWGLGSKGRQSFCQNGVCTLDYTDYSNGPVICYDKDRTIVPLNLNDPSLAIPSAVVTVSKIGVKRYNDFCDPNMAMVREISCPLSSNPQPSSLGLFGQGGHEVRCTDVGPVGAYSSCGFYGPYSWWATVSPQSGQAGGYPAGWPQGYFSACI